MAYKLRLDFVGDLNTCTKVVRLIEDQPLLNYSLASAGGEAAQLRVSALPGASALTDALYALVTIHDAAIGHGLQLSE